MEFEIKNNQDFPEFYTVRGNRLTPEEYSRLLILRSLISAYNDLIIKQFEGRRKFKNEFPKEMRLRNTNGSVPRVAKLLSCGTGYIYHMV
jgi:hypothetical protein